MKLDQDPVCGMMVHPDAPLRTTFEGQRYLFCCRGCLERFEEEPRRFLVDSSSSRAAQGQAPDTSLSGGWTCPMHPQIVADKPGACPICGMALEPKTVALEETENPELRSMRRRFWVGSALSAPLMVIAMADLIPGAARSWVELVLATPVVLWGGWPFFERAVGSVRRRSLNMFTLIGLGVAVAYGYSLIAAILPRIFPSSFRDAGGQVSVYFEAAAAIVTLALLGQLLELRARSQAGAAIRALLDLAPKLARRLRPDGQEEDVALSELRPGDRLRVRPGEKVPVDGTVLDGRSAIDESMLTGESIPLPKQPGAPIIGGTLNGTGSFVMRAERAAGDTLLAQIVRMVGQAQRSRPPIQRLADRVAGIFVPAVIGSSGLTFGLWALLGPEPRLAHALVSAIAVLIIACPCALGLATPMSILVATGKAATLGILFKNAEAIEILHQVETLAVDKTGTLTEGKPKLVSVVPFEGFDARHLVHLAATVERGSEHPLAGAIVEGALERGLELGSTEAFTSVTGEGVKGKVGDRSVAVGSGKLLDDLGVPLGQASERAESLRAEGQTVVFVLVDERLAGLLGVADPIKATTPEALRALRADGLRVVIMTGDHRTTAESVAQKLGIEEVMAELLPAEKAQAIERMQESGRAVAMAGDGINDAPALAQADVGIAMGTGTDVALESAGLTLVKGDLRGIVRARRLSRATMTNIRQNLFFAFIYNGIGVPIAAGILYPFFGVLLSPTIAAAAAAASSLSVIGNALRLRRFQG